MGRWLTERIQIKNELRVGRWLTERIQIKNELRVGRLLTEQIQILKKKEKIKKRKRKKEQKRRFVCGEVVITKRIQKTKKTKNLSFKFYCF